MLPPTGVPAIGTISGPARGQLRAGSRKTPDVRPRRRWHGRAMTDFVPPVLVGIDGTASGLEALELGSALAVLTGAPLVLGAVYGHRGHPELVWPSKQQAEAWLTEAQGRIGDAVVWSTRLALSSSPARGLTMLATLESARMIVIGSCHRGPLGRVLVGSTGRHVVHGAPCAVAIAPHDWSVQPPDVAVSFGVGFIDSPEARDALALGAALASAADAPLKLLSVVHLPPPAHPMFAATGTSYGHWCRERLSDAEATARSAVAELAPQVEPEVEVLEGDPVARLADASHGFDMLVVGSRRYGPLRSALLGGVSSALVEHAACPIVIVPRGVHPDAPLLDAVEAAAHA
jgi:nucleotide-binding universal stress UspA family protein